MSKITYKNANAGPKGTIFVFVDGKKVGAIHKRNGGFVYRTKSGAYGNLFPTLEMCKESLEAE